VSMGTCSGSVAVTTAGATIGLAGAGVATSVYPQGLSCSWVVTPPPPSGLTEADVWYTSLSVRCRARCCLSCKRGGG
jgi:hypothetical protein